MKKTALNHLSIGRADFDELPDILVIQKEIFTIEGARYNNFDIPPLKQTLAEIENDYRRGVILKAEINGKLVGSVRAYEENGIVYIGKLMVVKNCQNHGVGGKLLNAVETHFPGGRFELFTGAQSESNLSLYRKNGYQEFERRKGTGEIEFIYLEKRPA